MKRVCIITGSRAEYGLLKPLIKKIKADEELELQLLVTGTHLSPEFGLTFEEIEDDGLTITDRIEIILSSDTPVGISKSMGLAMIGFAGSFQRLQPDILLVLGDRYEIFSAVSAAAVARIPVAHLHGGETTEGAYDEAFRHSITKMSHLHFTATEEYRKRVIQLGEEPARVINVGALGVENIKTLRLLSKAELEERINFKFGSKTALVTYHPVTLEKGSSRAQFINLLNALDQVDNLKIIFTKANADTDGRIINKMIDDYVERKQEKAAAFTSMGQVKYLSAMKYADIVVGNSSSGIIEAPSFNVPTVNIGDRQRGRLQAASVINCRPVEADILAALSEALSPECQAKAKGSNSPYGEGNVSEKIIQEIKKRLSRGIKLKKTFYDLK